jgi:hypothetical protein
MGCIDVNNDANLNKFNNNHKGGVWFVWFYADWCGHCKQMIEPWNELVNNNVTNVNLAKVRDDYVPKIISKPNIQGWPTIILYKNGQPVDTYQGDRNTSAFNDYLSNNNVPTNQTGDVDRDVNELSHVIKLSKPTRKSRRGKRSDVAEPNKKKKKKGSRKGNNSDVDEPNKKKKKKGSRKGNNSGVTKPKKKKSARQPLLIK